MLIYAYLTYYGDGLQPTNDGLQPKASDRLLVQETDTGSLSAGVVLVTTASSASSVTPSCEMVIATRCRVRRGLLGHFRQPLGSLRD